MADRPHPPRPADRLKTTGRIVLAIYALLVAGSAAGVGLLARRGLSSSNGFLVETGPVLAALTVGVLGAVIAHRSTWFRR